jgi:adenylate cyclase
VNTQLFHDQKLVRGIGVGLAGALLALALWGTGWLESWELKSWDWRVQLLATAGPTTDDIRLILLDQRSLDWGEEAFGWPWPWPRQIFAEIIKFCQRSGAKALALDVIFTEFSSYGVEDDAALGSAIEDFPAFAGTLVLSRADGSAAHWPEDTPAPSFTLAGLNKWLTPDRAENLVFPLASLPIPEVRQYADVLGDVNQRPDPDAVFRRITLFRVFDDTVVPSLGLGAYLAAHPDTQLMLTANRLHIGTRAIPVDWQGNAILRYRGTTSAYKTYSAATVLGPMLRLFAGEELPEADRALFEEFRDKYVLFGYSAPGLKDLRPTPLDETAPGVSIHATVLDNFLANDFIRQTPSWATIVLVLAAAIACAVLASFFSKPLENLLIGAVWLAVPAGLAIALYLAGVWLPFFVQELAVGLTTILALAVNYATEGRQKRFLKDAFKHYLSPMVIEQLIQHPDKLKLGGERRVLSIYFSDIQGFTSISENLDPEALTALLNDYLSAMTDIIHEEGGTVDKYEGDAIIAFWNAPLDVPDHVARAVRAALRCQAKLAAMRPAFQKRVGKALYVRIGLNTGTAVVGNMGSHTRFDYTMLGDAVNLASRLEGANKQFGTYTMISQFTREHLDDATVAVRELGRIAVVGRKEPVTVYEPMLPATYAARQDVFEAFAGGLTLFYQGQFARAREVFLTIRAQDPAAAAYADKCQTYITTPPEQWDGVWMMTSK